MLRITQASALLVFSTSLLGFIQQETAMPEIERRYQSAQQALQALDYPTAEKEWRAIIALQPRLAEAHGNLGLVCHLQNKFDCAIQELQTALELKPELTGARLFLGISYYLTAQLEDAVEHLRQIVAGDPANALARRWLGASYLDSRDYPRAIEQLQILADQGSQDEEELFLLGRAYLRFAARNYRTLLEARQDSRWAALIRAELYSLQENSAAARRELEAIPNLEFELRDLLKNVSGDPTEVFSMIFDRHAAGSCQDASGFRQILGLLDQKPDDPRLLYSAGRCAAELAMKTLGEFEKRFPQSYRNHQLLAEYYGSTHQFEEADREYRKALEFRPKTPGIHLAIGELYLTQMDYGKALQQFKAELENDRFSVAALEKMGLIYVHLRQTLQAKESLIRAIEIRPKSPEAHQYLGTALFLEKDFERAIGHLQEALELGASPDSTVYFLLGQAFQKTGQPEKAREYFQKMSP